MIPGKIKTACIILGGGRGTRMKESIPKQFLKLNGKRIASYSLNIFKEIDEISEIVIVCAEEYRDIFSEGSYTFANPGERRQDSVYNGVMALQSDPDFICIHDSARPLVTKNMAQKVIYAAYENGAAALGVPVKFTIKELDTQGFVKQTPNRDYYWEIQTPQVIKSSLLREGFHYINENKLTVSDDVSIIELMRHPVKLVEGCYSNIKITTVEDLFLAEKLLCRV